MLITRLVVVLLCSTVTLKSAIAQDEYASFQSFYENSSGISWPAVIAIAAVTGGIVLVSGGAGAPFAAPIGTWIGGAMGLQGIAATNAGLALLGGGSLAAGGLGIAGGSAVIASTSSVALDVLFAAGGQVWSGYNYRRLAEQSVLLPTLGLPVADTGSILYETAMESISDKKLEKVESEEEIEFVKSVIAKAMQQSSLETQGRLEVSSLGFGRNIAFTTEEKARNEALLALLFFIINDYENSQKHAYLSIEHGRIARIDRGLPAFLYATASLYDDDLNFSEITDQYFEYSIKSQTDTDFIPTMFSIYMDRMLLRFEDGELSVEDLDEIRLLMDSEVIPAELGPTNYTLLLTKYIGLIGKVVHEVSVITGSTNPTIRSSPDTLIRLNISLQRLEQYTEKSKIVVERLKRISASNKTDEQRIADIGKLIQEWNNLVGMQPQLSSKVREFDERQSAEILARASAEALVVDGVSQQDAEPKTVAEAIVRLIQLLNSDSRID